MGTSSIDEGGGMMVGLDVLLTMGCILVLGVSEDVYSVTDSRLIQERRSMGNSREEYVVVCCMCTKRVCTDGDS